MAKLADSSTDTGTDNDTENSVTTGTDNRYFDNPVLVLVFGTFEIATTGTGNRYSNRVLTKGLIISNLNSARNCFYTTQRIPYCSKGPLHP